VPRESFFVRFFSSRLAVGVALLVIVLLLAAVIMELLEWWLWGTVMGSVIFAFVGYGFGRDYFARKRDEKFAEGMGEEAKSQAARDRGAATSVAQMHQHWLDGFQRLREKLKGRGAIYDLPWFVIVGRSGTGKTCAIRNSGLDFPLDFDTDRGTKGVGGTRNCDWFFADEAILLDTAGRYSEGEQKSGDQKEWLEFLGLLRKYRRDMPINGLLVAAAADDLLSRDSKDIVEDARRMRERLDELIRELKIQFPVFLLITKCDLVQGFSDFFGRLPRARHSELLGWTNPTWEMQGFQQQIDEALKGLRERVGALRPALLRDEERPAAVRNIFLFPDKLRALTDAVMQYSDALFRETRFNESAFLRGIYFTSALQTGSTIDDIVKGLGVAYEPLPSSKSYFLEDFFKERLQEDSKLVVPTGTATRRLRTVNNLGLGVVALLAVVFAAFATGSYLRNRVLLNRIQKSIEKVDELPQMAAKDQADQLNGYWTDLEILRERADNPNWLERMGLFKGRKALPKAESAFMGTYETVAHRPALEHAREALAQPDDPPQSVAALTALIDYLVATRIAREKDVPTGGEKLAVFWNDEIDQQGQKHFASAYRFYIRDPWRADGPSAAGRREQLDGERAAQLAAVRAALPELLTLKTIGNWLADLESPLVMPDEVTSDSLALVRGAFSPPAWKDKVTPLVDAIGQIQPELDGYTTEPFVRAYARAYYQQWLDVLLGLRASSGAANLTGLCEGAGAYVTAFDKVRQMVKDPIDGVEAPAWTTMLAQVVAKKQEYEGAVRRLCAKAQKGDQCLLWKTAAGGDPFMVENDLVKEMCKAAESDDPEQGAQSDELSAHCVQFLAAPVEGASRASRQKCMKDFAGQVAGAAGGGGGGDKREKCEPLRQTCQEQFAQFVDCQLGVARPGPIQAPGALLTMLKRCKLLEDVLGTPENPKVHAIRVTSLLGSDSTAGLRVVESKLCVLCGERDFCLTHRNILVEGSLRWSTACDQSKLELGLGVPGGGTVDQVELTKNGPCSLVDMLGEAERSGQEYTWKFPDKGVSSSFRVAIPERLQNALRVFCDSGTEGEG